MSLIPGLDQALQAISCSSSRCDATRWQQVKSGHTDADIHQSLSVVTLHCSERREASIPTVSLRRDERRGNDLIPIEVVDRYVTM